MEKERKGERKRKEIRWKNTKWGDARTSVMNRASLGGRLRRENFGTVYRHI